MKYFSMFSGIGGFEKGIEDAEKSIGCKTWGEQSRTEWEYQRNDVHVKGEQQTVCNDKIKSNDSTNDKGGASQHNGCSFHWECVGYSEIDRYATSIYRYHYPEHINYGDATTIDVTRLPEFDCIVGGFPCQSFSIAGKRRGFEDTRGTLFFEILRIARAKRTKYLWLENVKGLLNHDKGNTFQVIIESLDELGYGYQWQVLDSQYHGVPQHRERVFIIANLRGTSRPEIFPFGEPNQEGNYVDGLKFIGGIMGDKNNMWLDDGKNFSRNFPQGQRIYSTDGVSAQLTAQGGGWGAKTGLYAIPMLTPDRENKRQNGRRFKTDGEPMFTITGTDKHGVVINTGIRRLTPKECERLQGFPDDWTKYGLLKNGKVVEISDAQRYKCCGNAVTTKVIKDIALKWNKSIK